MSNDRFKFRVWDSLDRKYLDAPAVWLDSDGYAHEVDLELSTIDYIIEQCTGLTDKNGKLIYEGDIVRKHFEDGGSMDKLVFYNELQCKWYTRYNFRCSPGDAAFWEFGHHISHELEIIGNIHDDQFREVTKMVEDKDNGTNESKS